MTQRDRNRLVVLKKAHKRLFIAQVDNAGKPSRQRGYLSAEPIE